MLRHAEMPKGSRRVPTVKDGFILGLPHGVSGRLLLANDSWSLAVSQNLLCSAAPSTGRRISSSQIKPVILSEVRRQPNAVEGPRVCPRPLSPAAHFHPRPTGSGLHSAPRFRYPRCAGTSPPGFQSRAPTPAKINADNFPASKHLCTPNSFIPAACSCLPTVFSSPPAF